MPGFTFTGITRRAADEKPPGAWSPEQVIDMLVERMAKGDFYILCPDNDVTWETDRKRIQWAAGGHHRKPPAAVALAPRLQGRVRGLHEDALMKIGEASPAGGRRRTSSCRRCAAAHRAWPSAAQPLHG